jgi:hypothetical protein
MAYNLFTFRVMSNYVMEEYITLYRMFQKELYNFESLHKFVQRPGAVF